MKFRTKQKHMIDFIFPISLFFIFALCALTVLLFAARIYRSTTENSSLNYSARSGLSYISEKIHQNDADGNILVGELCGETALIMEQTYKDSVYYTYIYSYEGALRELYIKGRRISRSFRRNKDSGCGGFLYRADRRPSV